MNVDDKNIDPLTNLSVTLGYSDQCIQTILNNDSGAGANAASRLDMTFVATNAVSELVWSPQRGLYLKSADRSFTNKDPSLLYGAGPFTMASGSSTDKPIDKEIFMASFAAYDLGIEVAREETSTRFTSGNAGIIPLSGTSNEPKTATSKKVEEMTNAADMYFIQKEDPRNKKAKDELELDVTQNCPTCKESIAGARDINEETHALGMKITVASEMHVGKECGANETKVNCVISTGKGHEKMPSLVDEDGKGKMVKRTPGISLLEKMESTSENDLKNLLSTNVCCAPAKIAAVESANEFENNIQRDDGLLHADKTLDVKQSFTNSKFQKDGIQGKSKVVSDEDGNKMMLNEEDGSHESVESCDSTGLFSTGKRRWDFEQQLIVGSKRVKRQMHESPRSSALIKHDSSFMNWISNMTKGSPKLTGGEAPSLPAALSNPDCRGENFDQDLITCNRNEDLGSRNIGFKSIFRSLYSRKRKVQEGVTLNADHETERSKDLELDGKQYNMNATPVDCRMVAGNVYKRFLPVNERFYESTSGNQVGPAVHSEDMSMNHTTIQKNNSSDSTESKNVSYLATDKENGTSFSSSQGKYKTNSTEKIDSEMLSERKTAQNFGFKGDPLESLWITRFTSKASTPFQNQDPSKKIIGVSLDYSADGMRLKPQSQNLIGSSSEHEHVEVGRKCTEEVPDRVTTAEASFSFYKIKGLHDDKSSCKMNPIIPSSRLKNSEAIASVFARRLDALKQIMPSDDPDSADCATVTCFFCGLKGHHLRECPEITDTELEDLLRNFNLYDGVKEVPCVCIRCFQLNHWAVRCPSVHKRARDEAEGDTSLANHCCPSKTLLILRNRDDKELKGSAAGALTACSQNDSGIEKGLTFDWKSSEAANSQQIKLNAKSSGKENASSSGVKRFRENKITPLSSFINGQVSDVPNGVFEAIRSLRLTRTDILKCMNSSLPLSYLHGYFLRLRLGKWEEGLGGTGYHAAYITGIRTENSQEKSKTSIAVNAGGMKCLVESQFISNHDFLEDELRAWWSATLRSNDKIPSEEELRLKIKEKEMLGF